MNVDIVMLTKNSLKPCLYESLSAIENNAVGSGIKVRLIVVDGNSTDGTIELINEKFSYLNPLIIKDDGNRATARQKGIEAVETELFAFIDSDVIICEGWLEYMIHHFYNRKEKVGAIWGLTKSLDYTEVIYKDALSKLYRKSAEKMSFEYGTKRGLTHDTMIRLEAVEGIQIHPSLHVFEDHFIRRYIESKGYKWEVAYIPFCYHSRHERVASEAYQDAYYGRLMKVHSRRWLAKHFFLWLPKLFYLLCRTRNRKLIGIEYRKEMAFCRATLRLTKEWFLRCENELSL